jgi:hypothetical protein
MGRSVWVVDHEGSDYDFVAVSQNNGDNYFAPTQLKEVIPQRVNPQASVQSVIDELAKYSEGLTVAIRVNQQVMLDLDKITIPSLRIAALWIYGAMSRDGSRWFLAGNLIEPEPDLSWIFDYPAS